MNSDYRRLDALKKRVRLIEPQSRQSTAFACYVRQWPLMGTVILGTILEERGHDVRIYNENISGSVLHNAAILSDLCESDYVGISIMTPTAYRGYVIADGIRERSARPRIMLGGVHATFRPDEAAEHADFVVKGEGENVIADIVEGRVEPGIIAGSPVEDLDSLPLPKHELIHDFSRLWAHLPSKAMYRIPILTSRGCPHGCRYCSVTALFGRRYRCRSAAKVIEDVRALCRKGYRGVFFYDDNFTARRQRTQQILRGIRELGIRWNAQTRLDFHWSDPGSRTRCDRDLLTAMQRAGGDVLYIGYETIEDETAKRWHKGYGGAGDLAVRSSEDTRILHDAGFWIHGMFMVGPEHDEQTVDGIVRFARRNRLESIQISALTPFPGTPLFEEAKEGLLLTAFPQDWDFYDGVHALTKDTRMGIKRYQEKLLDAHRRFYRSVGLSLRRVRKVFQGPGTWRDKLSVIRSHIKLPREVFVPWEREMHEFLRKVAAIDVRYLLRPRGIPVPAAARDRGVERRK